MKNNYPSDINTNGTHCKMISNFPMIEIFYSRRSIIHILINLLIYIECLGWLNQ